MTAIAPGTIACIGLCDRKDRHRHDLINQYGYPSRMNEVPTFTNIVIRLCEYYGLRAKHDPDSRKGNVRGWPDLEIWGGSEILYVELKRSGMTLSVAQRQVGSQLTASGGDWRVWRPMQLYDSTIEQKLFSISSPVLSEPPKDS